MNYTICSFDKIQGSLIIDLIREGNKFIVALYDRESKTLHHNKFDSITDACEVYEKLISWCIFGYYTTAEKIQFLETGTMD